MGRETNTEGLELARKVNTRLTDLRNKVGTLTALETTDKTSLVAAINELKGLITEGGGGLTSVGNGVLSYDDNGTTRYLITSETNPFPV